MALVGVPARARRQLSRLQLVAEAKERREERMNRVMKFMVGVVLLEKLLAWGWRRPWRGCLYIPSTEGLWLHHQLV